MGRHVLSLDVLDRHESQGFSSATVRSPCSALIRSKAAIRVVIFTALSGCGLGCRTILPGGCRAGIDILARAFLQRHILQNVPRWYVMAHALALKQYEPAKDFNEAENC